MNEEANFCSQCGVTVSTGAKFCSSCGHDLKNSPNKITSDKTVKVELTNATVEKGFKAIEKGVKATPSIIKGVWPFLKTLLIVLTVISLIAGAVTMLYMAGFLRPLVRFFAQYGF